MISGIAGVCVDGPIVRCATDSGKSRRRNPGSRWAEAQPSIRSTTVAIPCPTPMHIVARPQRPPVRRSSWLSIVIRRAPLIPSGWPSAIAPPLTLTFAGSSPSSSMQTIDWLGERLVELDEVEVVDADPGPLERLAGRRARGRSP